MGRKQKKMYGREKEGGRKKGREGEDGIQRDRQMKCRQGEGES